MKFLVTAVRTRRQTELYEVDAADEAAARLTVEYNTQHLRPRTSDLPSNDVNVIAVEPRKKRPRRKSGVKPEDHFRAHKAEALMWLSRVEYGLSENRDRAYVRTQLESLRGHLEEWEFSEDAARIWVEYCDRVRARGKEAT
jgi:hypothetical protein